MVMMRHRAGAAQSADPPEAEVRHWLEGNLCRCTGYHNIVKAVLPAAETHARRCADERAEGLGASVKRREDRRFLLGKGRYTDDIQLPDQTCAVFVRSPHAQRDDRVDRRLAAARRRRAWWPS